MIYGCDVLDGQKPQISLNYIGNSIHNTYFNAQIFTALISALSLQGFFLKKFSVCLSMSTSGMFCLIDQINVISMLLIAIPI